MIQPPRVARTSGGALQAADKAPPRSFDLFDIKQYFHIIFKRIWLVALCFFVAVGVTMVMAMRQEPLFRARATLLLSQGLPLPAQLRPEELRLWGEYLATQQLILQSGTLRNKAQERITRAGGALGEVTTLRAYQVAQTAFLAIEVDSPDPVFAAGLANALAEEYLDFKAGERMDTSQATVISLTQQANRLLEELKKAETRVVAFEKENSVVAIFERGNIAANTLAGLSRRAADLRTERMLLESQRPLLAGAETDVILATLAWPEATALPAARNTVAALGGEETPEEKPEETRLLELGVIKQESWTDLKRQQAVLEARLASYRTRFQDKHPLIQETLVALADNQKALEVESQYALRQFTSRLESLALMEQAARRVEKEWEEDAIESNRKAQDYKTLQRTVERLQKLYDLVFNRLKEIDISIGIEPGIESVMEWAKPPTTPITTRKVQMIFIAALAGLVVGLGLVFGLEYIDDSIRYPDEVARWFNLPFLGVVPAADWDPVDLRSHLLSNIDQRSALAEAYRNVRSAFLFSGVADRTKALLLTSAVPREGKTTTCLNLAVSLSQIGERVLVVDGDLRRGELHKFFGLEGGRGLSDVLIGQAKPDAVIQRTVIPNLDFVATGPLPPNPSEIILRPEMKAFLDFAGRTYDRILFDCPPIMAVSEAVIMAAMMDAVLFVVWAGQTSRKLSQLAIQLLRERGAHLIGCVLNNLEFSRVGYYYYSTYYGYYEQEMTPPSRSTGGGGVGRPRNGTPRSPAR